MNKKSIITILLAAIIVLAGFLLFNSQQAKAPANNQEQTEAEKNEDLNNNQQDLAESEKAVKEFSVTGTPFQFSIKEIRVNKGDVVRINFENGQGTHDWVIDEF